MELVVEAQLPIVGQAALSSGDTEAAIALGNLRASTIRKRVWEWGKPRVFSLALGDSAWPKHAGIVFSGHVKFYGEGRGGGRLSQV